MTPFKIILFIIILLFAYHEPKACEFGCKPFVNCMPCSLVKGNDGKPIASGGWCYIRGKR